jgi:threonine dehydrogenase-like Zn-dependent dehydrogenase
VPIATQQIAARPARKLLISASFADTSAAFAEVAALLGTGEIKAAPLITHRFLLEDYEEAYPVLRPDSGARGKVMLEVSAP